MYCYRQVSERLKMLCGSFPVVVVCGARQTGKTTLLRHLFPHADYVVFDPGMDVEHARQDPDLFLRNHRCPLILDEVQYAPEVVAAVKRHVDGQPDAPGRYLMTGSQQWQVMRTLAESLAGRTAFLDLDGFGLAEIAGIRQETGWLSAWLNDGDQFVASSHRRLTLPHALYETLWRGCLPRAALMETTQVGDFWLAYQRTYVERDARLLTDVADWQQFGLFLRLMGALTAQEVHYSQLGRDLGMTPGTAKRWLHVLRGTFQWFDVPAFSGNLVKRVSSKPKGYLTDTGLVCHGQQITAPTALGGHPLYGALFETAVVAEVRKQASTLQRRPALHHWRSAGGAEVDLLLERDGCFYPIEIKGATNPGPRDASGIQAFRRSYPNLRVAQGLVVAPIEHPRRLTEDAFAIPWDLEA
jgi:predicted AAA+ superfamily ATPase